MNLIIVESPTKARTLSRFLGKGFAIEATMGHIKDLPKSKLGVEIEKDFKPSYLIVEQKNKSIEKVRETAKKSKVIFIATDPDREGEAIAQHVKEILVSSKSSKVNSDKLHRIVFHEITKSAVEKAIDNPRKIDKNLVNAQIARRVLDRLVGYKLSPLLWRKVRRGLSAGRVQTVVVRFIVEREREIDAFKPEEYWEILVAVENKQPLSSGQFIIKLIKIEDKKAAIVNKIDAEKTARELKTAKYKVIDIKKKEVRKYPASPFTTSTLTQTSSRRYFWSAKKTMMVAQKLYEEGLITYHRTDSTNIAKSALSSVRAYILKEYGTKYLPVKPRYYKTKAKVAQEAHEAIRPTSVAKSPGFKLRITTKDGAKLYELIWKRFVASQMEASVYDDTRIDVRAEDKSDYLLRVGGQVMKFDGWRKIIAHNDTTKIDLPRVEVDETLDFVSIDPQQKFTQPPSRYSEASLIKKLEELGIGRPSTYAPTISVIQVRNYVEKKEGRFYPTPVGIAANDFLTTNFPKVFSYSFTADMEDDLDKIANGRSKWVSEIKGFWDPFEKKLDKVTEKSKRVKIETEKLGKKCPTCKKGELVIRIGRFGKFISCSRFPDCKHTEKYVDKIGMKCPDCKKGEVIIKQTKKRRKFYGCSRYPKCNWASWRKPAKDTTTSD